MSKTIQRVDYSLLPDKQLAEVAVTMVFIWLGPRAVWALVDACVDFAKRHAHA